MFTWVIPANSIVYLPGTGHHSECFICIIKSFVLPEAEQLVQTRPLLAQLFSKGWHDRIFASWFGGEQCQIIRGWGKGVSAHMTMAHKSNSPAETPRTPKGRRWAQWKNCWCAFCDYCYHLIRRIFEKHITALQKQAYSDRKRLRARGSTLSQSRENLRTMTISENKEQPYRKAVPKCSLETFHSTESPGKWYFTDATHTTSHKCGPPKAQFQWGIWLEWLGRVYTLTAQSGVMMCRPGN